MCPAIAFSGAFRRRKRVEEATRICIDGEGGVAGFVRR
jgi:hypothetical protein